MPGGTPIGLATSPNGIWAYVLIADATNNGFIQAVNLARIRANQPATASAPFAVGKASVQIIISADGQTLYVPFEDANTAQAPGGIAVVKVSESNCRDILWRDCPSCCEANCIVLATIANYHAVVPGTG